MSRLPDPAVLMPRETQTNGNVLLNGLIRASIKVMRMIVTQLNGVSDGRMAYRNNAQETAPTAGIYAQGDYTPNSKPVLLGVAGAHYVVKGWICIGDGEPGTWVEDRASTGT